MTTVPSRPSTSPRWDTLNEGFVSPARLQQWKQENERVHTLGSPLSQPMSQDPSSSRSAPERRNTSTDSHPGTNGSPSKLHHRPKPSFASFFSRKSANLDDHPALASSPPAQRSPAAENASAPKQMLQNPPQSLSSQRGPAIDGNAQGSSRIMQQPPPPQQRQQQQQQGPPPPQPMQPQSNAAAPQQPPPLHPEIRSVVQLTLAHAHKIYFSGPLVRCIERQPDGQKPAKDEGWREVWAQLGGTTLSVWDMAEIQEASKQGRQVPPTYINVTDAFVNVLGSIALPPTPGAPQRRYTNVLTLNTAGSNLYLFSCPSSEALISWTAAMRLAAWEKSRLEEIYTAHLIRITLNDGRNTPSTLANGRLEGWVRIRIAGQTDWKRMWMVISAGNHLGHPDRGSIDSTVQDRPDSPNAPRKRRMSHLFSRDKSPGQPNLPARPMIQGFTSARPKDRKKALLTMRSVSQAFAVYPERPELISRSTLMKLEGQLGDEEMAGVLKMREAWLLVMPELEGANTRASEMLRWIIGIHDAFELYGRPRLYSWDPRDTQSMMFGYPVGTHRDSLFLDREFGETLDPRDDRTSAIRAQFQRILLGRVSGAGPQGPTSLPSGQGPPTLPPLPSITTVNDLDDRLPSPKAQVAPPAGNGKFSLQLPPLNFESGSTNADNRVGEDRRPLSPITERSTPLDGKPHSDDKLPFATRPQPGLNISPPRAIPEEPTILQQPLVSSPIASSPPPPSDNSVARRASVDSHVHSPYSRPDSKLSQRPGQVVYMPSQSSSSNTNSPTVPVDNVRQQTPPEPHPSPSSASPFAAPSPRSFSPPRAVSPLRANTQRQPEPFMTTPPPPLSTIRMVPDRSISQTSIPTSLRTIPTPPMTHAATPPPLHSPISPSPPPPESKVNKRASLTDDVLGDAGAALFYMQHMQQQDSVLPTRKRGPPPPKSTHDDEGDEDSSSDSESEPYTPPPRAATSPVRVRKASSPPHSASPKPPAVPAKSLIVPAKLPKSEASVDQAPTRSTTEAPITSRPGGSLRNRPSGARAAPSTRLSAYLQNSSHQDTTPSESTAPTSYSEKGEDSDGMASSMPPAANLDDPHADALAALSFLEQEDRPAPPQSPPQPRASSTTGSNPTSLPEVVETPASPSQTRLTTEMPRSSFAPTRLAAERKAKTQAQQAAQQAAAHRPGKASGRGRGKPKDSGAWGDSSDEEEDEEEEDDEDVDSDAEPPLRSGVSVSDHASMTGTPRSLYGTGGVSPSRSSQEVNSGAFPSPRRPRDLPQVPAGQVPEEYLGAQPSPRRFLSENLNDSSRRNLYPAEGGSRGPSPQFGQSSLRPQTQYPMQQQFQQPQQGPSRQIWSQVLDPDRHVEPNNGRETFIQMEAPATTMTKAFTPHGLLSAGLQDKQDRSAKKQEELARETGASLINVPTKPPPPQTGLLGAVTAHERERKREGGLGAALTEREREKRVAEERQRKLDEFQRQQLEQMQQGGSMYGGNMMGFNPMMANPMMMGMNPMMTGGWGFPGMMPGFANPQQLFAAQQAAAQAYQQAMVAFSTAGSQMGGNDAQGQQGPMNPMLTGNSMGMGGFDPRMSMMSMPMMGAGMGGMNPMGMTPTGMTGMGGMGGMGVNPMVGAGMGMQMTGNSQFDPRFSPGLESSPRQQQQQGEGSGSHALSSQGSSPAPGPQASATGTGANASDASHSLSGPPSNVQ